jgi:ribosomal protein L13E
MRARMGGRAPGPCSHGAWPAAAAVTMPCALGRRAIRAMRACGAAARCSQGASSGGTTTPGHAPPPQASMTRPAPHLGHVHARVARVGVGYDLQHRRRAGLHAAGARRRGRAAAAALLLPVRLLRLAVPAAWRAGKGRARRRGRTRSSGGMQSTRGTGGTPQGPQHPGSAVARGPPSPGAGALLWPPKPPCCCTGAPPAVPPPLARCRCWKTVWRQWYVI